MGEDRAEGHTLKKATCLSLSVDCQIPSPCTIATSGHVWLCSSPAACRQSDLTSPWLLGNVLRSEKQVAYGVPKLQRQPKNGGSSKHALWSQWFSGPCSEAKRPENVCLLDISKPRDQNNKQCVQQQAESWSDWGFLSSKYWGPNILPQSSVHRSSVYLLWALELSATSGNHVE